MIKKEDGYGKLLLAEAPKNHVKLQGLIAALENSATNTLAVSTFLSITTLQENAAGMGLSSIGQRSPTKEILLP